VNQINLEELLGPAGRDLFAQIAVTTMIMTLLIAFVVGACIFYIYKKSFNGVVYSHSFNISLAIVTILVSLIVLTISTNIVLSLGMVGALSIIRYRTAIKDPLDLMFLLWAIASGIAVGAGTYVLAIIGGAVVVFSLWFFGRFYSNQHIYILIIRYDSRTAEDRIKEGYYKLSHQLKSRIQKNDIVELTVELSLPTDGTRFVDDISQIQGVESVSLIQYNGDYIG